MMGFAGWSSWRWVICSGYIPVYDYIGRFWLPDFDRMAASAWRLKAYPGSDDHDADIYLDGWHPEPDDESIIEVR